MSLTANTNPNRVLLLGNPPRKELEAGGAITPGHLCQRASTGKLVVHAVPGGIAQPLFALEDSLQGQNITDAYASADQVIFASCRPGDEVYALLDYAETVSIGDFLESNGDGTLRKLTAGASSHTLDDFQRVVGCALEAVTTDSDSYSRIKIEVM